MSKEEAIKLIMSDGLYSKEVMDALQEPFNANQHNSNALNDVEQHTNALEGDLISRQAVLNCLTACGLKKFDFILDARDKVKNLPSVNPPEPRTGHCKDCKHFREIPYHFDTCIQHRGLCPKGDWYCADFEPQESEEG